MTKGSDFDMRLLNDTKSWPLKAGRLGRLEPPHSGADLGGHRGHMTPPPLGAPCASALSARARAAFAAAIRIPNYVHAYANARVAHLLSKSK